MRNKETKEERQAQMTSEQEKEIEVIGHRLQEIFPDFHGSIKFNLQSGRNDVRVNIEECKNFERTKR